MKNILIIDSIEENLSITKDILCSDYEVASAGSLEEAFESVDRNPPDILLINHIMPELDGVSLMQKLVKKDNPFITMLMTNSKDIEIVVDGILHGFDGFIRIPVELNKFEEQLKKAEEIHKMRKDACNYAKIKAIRAMSITFAHYIRNLLTPLMGYLSKIKEEVNIPENVQNAFEKNLNKMNELTYKIEELFKKKELNEFSYTDNTEFYNLDLDEEPK